ERLFGHCLLNTHLESITRSFYGFSLLLYCFRINLFLLFLLYREGFHQCPLRDSGLNVLLECIQLSCADTDDSQVYLPGRSFNREGSRCFIRDADISATWEDSVVFNGLYILCVEFYCDPVLGYVLIKYNILYQILGTVDGGHSPTFP